jgi:flagellar biosynthetic protein FliR
VDSVELVSWQSAYLSRLFLAFVRVLGALSLNPIMGSTRVPLPGRIALGLMVTLVLFPPGGPDGSSDCGLRIADCGLRNPVSVGPVEIAGELVVGLAAGFAVSLVFSAAQFAASLIGVNSGLNFASTLDPHSGLGSSALDQLFSLLAVLVFLQINGHHLFLMGLRELFQTVEVGRAALVPPTVEALGALMGSVFTAGVRMALPTLAALMLADLGLAVLARAAPQLNLFVVGLPAKLAIAFAVLVVALPWIVPGMAALFRRLPESMMLLAR